MAEKRLTKWQNGWSLLEDGNGDQMGEYLRKKDEENATCDWCSVSFKFSLNGISGIKQHANSKKHIDVADLKKNRNKGQQRLISVSAADDQNNTGIRAAGAAHLVPISANNGQVLALPAPPTIWTLSDKVVKAEVQMLLKAVESQYTYSSLDNIVPVLKRMDPDSKIFEKMKLHEDKASYDVAWGLAPFFKRQVI